MCFCFPSKSYALEPHQPKPKWRYVRQRVEGRVVSRQIMRGDKIVDYGESKTAKGRQIPAVITQTDRGTAKQGVLKRVRRRNVSNGKSNVPHLQAQKAAGIFEGRSNMSNGTSKDKGKEKASEVAGSEWGKEPGKTEGGGIGVPSWQEHRVDEWGSVKSGTKDAPAQDASDKWNTWTPGNDAREKNEIDKTSSAKDGNEWEGSVGEKPKDENEGNKDSTDKDRSTDWSDWAPTNPTGDDNTDSSKKDITSEWESWPAADSRDDENESNNKPSDKDTSDGWESWTDDKSKADGDDETKSSEKDGDSEWTSSWAPANPIDDEENNKESSEKDPSLEWTSPAAVSNEENNNKNKSSEKDRNDEWGEWTAKNPEDENADDSSKDQAEASSSHDNTYNGKQGKHNRKNRKADKRVSFADNDTEKTGQRGNDSGSSEWTGLTGINLDGSGNIAANIGEDKGSSDMEAIKRFRDEQKIPGAWPVASRQEIEAEDEPNKVDSWQGVRGERTEIGKNRPDRQSEWGRA